MSYDIVRSIRVIDGKVIARAACNNVTPRDYSPQESTYLTRVLQEEGATALTLEILHAYESGSFQAYSGVTNRYTRTIEHLRQMPEYQAFDWQVCGNDEYKKVSANRSENREGLRKLLLRAYLATPRREEQSR